MTKIYREMGELRGAPKDPTARGRGGVHDSSPTQNIRLKPIFRIDLGTRSRLKSKWSFCRLAAFAYV